MGGWVGELRVSSTGEEQRAATHGVATISSSDPKDTMIGSGEEGVLLLAWLPDGFLGCCAHPRLPRSAVRGRLLAGAP